MNTLTQPLPLDDVSPREAAERTRPLQRRLLLLALVVLLPAVLAAAGSLAYVMLEAERAVQRTALHTARAIAVALRAEVEGTVGMLQALADDESLEQGQLPQFGKRARRMVDARGWRAVTVADAQGHIVLSTSTDARTEPIDPASLQEAIEEGRPVVGRLFTGPQRRGPAFAVRLPVLRGGKVQHVVTAVLGSGQVLELVRRQNLPEGHVVAIFDPAGARIARSVEHSIQGPSPTLRKLLARGGGEGMGPTLTLEGTPAHTGFHRVPQLDWVVAVGIPASEARRAVLASTALAAMGLLVSIAISAWLAWRFSRRLLRPVDELKSAAAALGRGEPLAPMRLDIDELDAVGKALVQASHDSEAAARERLAAEAERERLLARATEALRRAEDAARSKDEFLAVLGHELRNPLAPISSALHLMSLKGDEATRSERRIVERQLAHMTRLVDDLLDVSRITTGKLRMRREPMRVGPWIEQVVDSVRGSIGARTLHVSLPDASAHAWVEGDAVRLAQVLGNLLGNAIKFTPEHGTIRLAAALEDGQVRVQVEDDGIGLSEDEAARVFDAFYQAPQGQHRATAGLGLGLAIVRSLVELHGGSVHVSSDGPGRGSRFALRLPLCAAPAGDPDPTAAGAEPAVRAGTRVLVVDDNVDAADTGAALLEACGFAVAVAYTPEDALRALDTFAADIGLLDIGLPGMDGYELARAVRALPRGGAIRLVALTGYGQDADVQRAHEAGFDAHMTKPVDPDALLSLLARLAPH